MAITYLSIKLNSHTKETTKENKKGLEIIKRFREEIKARKPVRVYKPSFLT